MFLRLAQSNINSRRNVHTSYSPELNQPFISHWVPLSPLKFERHRGSTGAPVDWASPTEAHEGVAAIHSTVAGAELGGALALLQEPAGLDGTETLENAGPADMGTGDSRDHGENH